MKQKIQGI